MWAGKWTQGNFTSTTIWYIFCQNTLNVISNIGIFYMIPHFIKTIYTGSHLGLVVRGWKVPAVNISGNSWSIPTKLLQMGAKPYWIILCHLYCPHVILTSLIANTGFLKFSKLFSLLKFPTIVRIKKAAVYRKDSFCFWIELIIVL
jgi:hypothetical protein